MTLKNNPMINKEPIIAEAERLVNQPTEIVDSDIIETDTYTPARKKLGNGCWGTVDEYLDPAGQSWAMKRFTPDEIAQKQMEHRMITEEKVMRNEAIPLSAARYHLVPRIIERDKKGRMFIGMPVIRGGTLENKLRYSQGLDKQSAIKLASQVAEALGYLHVVLDRAHGDVKPANILLDGAKEDAMLTDLGSSVCVSVSDRTNPRDRIGDKNYRSPEGFKDDSKPTNYSDVFSLGALVCKMFTGHGIYDRAENLENMTEKEIKNLIKRNTRILPYAIRKFVRKATNFNPYERYHNGQEAKKDLEDLAENMQGWKSIKKSLRKGLLHYGIPATILGVILYNSMNAPEPQKLDLPSISPRMGGIIYRPGTEAKENIVFDEERIADLPEAQELDLFSKGGMDKLVKYSTDNRVVAYLAKTHAQTGIGARKGADHYTENEANLFTQSTDPNLRAYTLQGPSGPVYPIITKAIEVALTLSKTRDGKIDLEDTMAIARVGVDKVLEAKRISGSQDYQVYRNAKNTQGKFIIPEKEQSFINYWLSYYHSDI